MKKTEVRAIHELYDAIAEEIGIEYEGTEYKQNGVTPISVHKSKHDHLEALEKISNIVVENLDNIPQPVEQVPRLDFSKTISGTKFVARSGDVSLHDSGNYILEIGDTTDEIGKSASVKYRVLSDLAEGDKLADAVDRRYMNRASNHLDQFDSLRKVLNDEERLLKEYRDDLGYVLEEACEIHLKNKPKL